MHAFDRLLGDVEPGVARRAEGVDLADGHGEVGVVRDRLVTPAPLVVLGVDDQPDGLLELLADLGPVGHAVGFGEEEGAEAVGVHRAVGGGAGDGDESGGGVLSMT